MKTYISTAKVAVLMATHNGELWLNSQIDTILAQENVDITLFISDDGSTDSTLKIIYEISKKDSRVILLPILCPTGSAGRNFYRLIQDINISNFDYFCLADQDDLWFPNKISRHLQLLVENCSDGVSSNVIAFWFNDKHKLIIKSQRQRLLDFIFESAGPGCTFLITPRLLLAVRSCLSSPLSGAYEIALHDWLIYAVCRASGYKWLIDYKPSVYYRQHKDNVVGVNSGLTAKFKRLSKFNNGWYKREVIKITKVCFFINPSKFFVDLAYIVNCASLKSRLKLLLLVGKARRKLIDRFYFAILVIFFFY
jgi:rhamnosyltransferase